MEMEKVRVGRQKCRTYAKGEKAYQVKRPTAAVVFSVETDEWVMAVRTKIKLVANGEVESERLIYDALAGVLERMTQTTLVKDQIYEMREACLITRSITPNLRNLDVIVREKENGQAPASHSIDPMEVDHE